MYGLHLVQSFGEAMAPFVGIGSSNGLKFYGEKRRLNAAVWPVAPDSGASERASRRELNIALCVPLGGVTGIWGPSALASAKLAASELNRLSGIGGRTCRLIAVDADDDAPMLELVLSDLVHSGEVDALVGMHTSHVRQRILSAIGGEILFVYTPLYEGGECTPGVFAIGDTPAKQLQPAIEWLAKHERPRRWAFLVNNYVWPHRSNRLARDYVARCGADVVWEEYVPLHTIDYSEQLATIRRVGADAVLLSLVGEDAVAFNRAFGEQGLGRSALRLSCAIEENELLAIGAQNTGAPLCRIELLRGARDRRQQCVQGALPQPFRRPRADAQFARPVDLRRRALSRLAVRTRPVRTVAMEAGASRANRLPQCTRGRLRRRRYQPRADLYGGGRRPCLQGDRTSVSFAMCDYFPRQIKA